MKIKVPLNKIIILLLMPVLFCLIVCLVGAPELVRAESISPEQPQMEPVDSDACLACHSTPGLEMALPNGDVLAVTVDGEVYAESVHGVLTCSLCHTTIEGYPHPELAVESKQDYTLLYGETCMGCHSKQYTEATNTAHEAMFNEDNEITPACTLCHKSHSQAPIEKAETADESADTENVPETTEDTVEAPVVDEPMSSTACLACHDNPGLEMKLTDGEVLSVAVSENIYEQSVHGHMECSVCHADITGYPHPETEAQSKRDYSLIYHDTCKECHRDQANEVSMSVHEQIFLAGDENAPTCVTCHPPHTQNLISEGDEVTYDDVIWISNTCAQCHQDVYETYAKSYHGEGLIAGKNSDMPTCINCHNVHSIGNPNDAEFRLDSIEMCANCHTDPEIMEKYGESVNILNTYVVFHGTTVSMLEPHDPESLRNKPTCYDCHGVHNVTEIANIPPPVVTEFTGSASIYPPIEPTPEPAATQNVAVTGIILGIIMGGAGFMTVTQLTKPTNSDDEINGEGE